MEEDQRRVTSAVVRIRWKEELPMKLEPVGSWEENRLGSDELPGWICRRNELGRGDAMNGETTSHDSISPLAL